MAGIHSKLDSDQVIRQAYDEANQRLRVDASVSAVIGEVSLTDPLTGDDLKINPDGSADVNVVNPLQITDGSQTATITNVAGKRALDVNVTDLTLDHSNDSVTLGDGTNLIGSTLHGGVRGLNVSLANPQVQTTAVAYKTIIDEVSASLSYIGKAVAGSSTSNPVWQIQRITVTGPQTIIEYAAGTTSFNQVWDNRTILVYS